MNEQEYRNLFHAEDDEKFVEQVSAYLQEDAHELHGLTAPEYVAKCRDEWALVEMDVVFCVKLLIDRRVQERRPGPFAQLVEQGFEREDLSAIPDSDIYAVCTGVIDPDGKYIGAPPDYEPPERPNDGRRGVAVAVPADVEVPDPKKPRLYALALFDVLGFEHMLSTRGIEEMVAKYSALIEVALTPQVSDLWTPILSPVGPSAFVPGLFRLPLEVAYFSDTILLWIPYSLNYIGPFLSRCMAVFCHALRTGVPLRGSISVGPMVLNKSGNTYLGAPLVEAARLEKVQEWIGVTLGVSVCSNSPHIPINHMLVRIYDAPVTPDGGALLSGLVLDWPRWWRERFEDSASEYVLRLMMAGKEHYHNNCLAFLKYSEESVDWFLKGA
jgi:hypothetical protein